MLRCNVLVQVAVGLVAIQASGQSLQFDDPILLGKYMDAVWTMEVADVDGDDDLDVIAALFNRVDPNEPGWGSDVCLFENLDGAGLFSVPVLVESDERTVLDIAIADIDGDGVQDVLTAGDGLYWHRNTGDIRHFDASHEITAGGNCWSVFVADLDHDGDQDVLAGYAASTDANHPTDRSLIWYENLASDGLTWSSHVVHENFANVHGVYAADLDGDDDLDLISISASPGELNWYQNLDGNGLFGNPILIAQITSGYSVTAADLNGDGALDIACGDKDAIRWYLNEDLHGSFIATGALRLGQIQPYQLTAIDFDNDGDLDIVAPHSHSDSIYWLNNIDGAGITMLRRTVPFNLQASQAATAADINQDGVMDLIGASLETGKITWSPGQFSTNPYPVFSAFLPVHSNLHNGPQGIEFADLDGDGNGDLVMSCGYYGSSLSWSRQYGNTTKFICPSEITRHVDSGWALEIAIGDYDGDGDLDVAPRPTYLYSALTWWRNSDGKGAFTGPVIVDDRLSRDIAVVAGDMNGDGVDDLVVSHGDDGIYWYANYADGRPAVRHAIDETIRASYSITVSDLDGDEDLDVLVDHDSCWYENLDGDGSFSTPRCLWPDAFYPFYITSGDIDGDGYLDIVTVQEKYLVWYKYLDTSGIFDTTPRIIDNLNYVIPHRIFVSDLDDDGDNDVTLALGWQLVAYLNRDGLGGFGQQTTIYAHVNQINPQIADIDNDGRPEALVPMVKDDQFVWYRNLTPPILRGDTNCDGGINAFDIDPFIIALLNPSDYLNAYIACNRMTADMNLDGQVDAFDIDPFIDCLIHGVCP